MAAGDKCIGKLTLNIDGVKKSVDEVNKMLESLGVGKKINISSKVTAAVKEALKEVTTMLQNSEKQITETTNKAVEAINKVGKTKVDNAEQKKALTEATTLLKEYYDLMKKAEQARASGDTRNQGLFSDAATTKLSQINDLLRYQAQAQESVNKKVLEYNAARNAADKKLADKEAKQEAQEIDRTVAAYKKWIEAKSKVKQLEIEGKQDTAEYAKAMKASGEAADTYKQKLKGLSDTAKETVKTNKEVAQLKKDLANIESATASDQQAAAARQQENNELTKAKQLYGELKDAIARYNAEKKQSNELGMATEQAKIDAIMEEVGIMEQSVQASNMEEAAKQRVLDIVRQMVTADIQHNAEVNRSVTETNELENQVKGLVTRYLSLMAVIRTINSLIQNTVEYVSSYSDKMNEIQMITLKSNEEVEKLADRYREIASEMNVSSLDMADAAIYFTRQGLQSAEIEKRLKNVTMYAKAANVEFKDASEIITAVVNSMGLVEQEAEDGRNAAQRVADVFLNIGDNAATSGQEIGEAMQKAAASAGAFGVSMEWLASYIAAVSETTRQEARTIGTAFNTIIARLHQIKTTGYNQEDETKVNDIAKALSKIDIVLMDQEGNWRDMEDILEEIAAQWDDLDGKTKSYIATSMAGVKQQNVFLALMNDMSKGVENNSRAYELHEKALESNGVAAEKYAVYLDSVTAAEERLTIAQENFYAILSKDVITGWYNMLAGIVNFITDATEALGGLNIIIPIITGAVIMLAAAITKAGSAAAFFNKMFLSNPVILGITAMIAAFTTLTGIVGTFAQKTEDMGKALDESKSRMSGYQQQQSKLSAMMEDIGEDTEMTNVKLEKYNGLLNDLALVSPTAADAVEKLKNGVIGQKEAYEQVNAELEKYIKNEQLIQATSLINNGAKLSDKSSSDKFAEQLLEHGGLLEAVLYGNIPKEINDFLSALFDAGYEDYDMLETLASNTYLDGQSASTYLAKRANELIDQYMNVIGVQMNEMDKTVVRNQLANMIFGDDGVLDFSEYQNMGKVANNFMSQAIAAMFDPKAFMSAKDYITRIGEDIFGSFFSMLFGDQIEQFVNSADADEAVAAISKMYSELLAAGFNIVDIGDLLRDTPLMDWDKVISAFTEQVQEKAAAMIMTTGGQYAGSPDTEGLLQMLEDLDLASLRLVNNMMDAGTSVDIFMQAFKDSKSATEFIQKLTEYAQGPASDEPIIKDTAEWLKDIKAAQTELNTLDEYLETLKDGKQLSFDDLLELTGAHPEIAGTIKDVEALKQAIEQLRQSAEASKRSSIEGMILDSEAAFGASKFAQGDKNQNGAKTLREYIQLEEEAGRSSNAAKLYVWGLVSSYIAMGETLEEDVDAYADLIEEVEKTQKEIQTLDGYIEKIRDGEGLDASDLINIAKSHKELVMYFGDLDTLQKKLEELRAASAAKTKQSIIEALMDDTEFFKNSIFNGSRGERGEVIQAKTLREYMAALRDGSREQYEVSQYVEQAAENLVEGAGKVEEAADTWLAAQLKISEADEKNNWAQSNGYISQVVEMQNALSNDGAAKALEIWQSYDEAMRKSISDTYPSILKAMAEMEAALDETTGSEEAVAKATDKANSAFSKTRKYLDTKYFKNTAKALLDLEKGTISATDAYDTFNKELDTVTKAGNEITNVQELISKGSKYTASDITNLANVLGVSADEIMKDFDGAVQAFDEMTGASGALQAAFDALNRAAFIKITGVSEADFSDLENGLFAVRSDAEDVIALLEATGQWEIQPIDLPQDAKVWDPFSQTWSTMKALGKATVLKPTGKNPYKGRGAGSSSGSGGGGGGGGGGGSQNSMTEVERMLDRMSQQQSIQEYQQSYYQAQKSYYSQTGQVQGVIGYSQKEIDLLHDQSATLKDNIARIEEYMEAKRKELSGLKTTDAEYEEVADDLDKLQQAHQEYTKQLIDNETAVEQLTQAIKDQQDKIRQMEIDLRQTILKAIEDREKRTQDMLNAEIQMENIVLDLIKKRYEKERDEIIDTTNLKIDALKEERDLLSEQLQLRKEQAEEEDKARQLAEYELQYQRISADPTRKKEALEIQKKIADLREEMAWDAAEKEVKAQQESIDQQITSLEDYIQYVEDYYEDLFEHPQKLIEEMKQIMQMTDEEIIEWLKENDEDYAKSTENTQKTMVESWQETLDTMHDVVKTHWDEVEEIIAQGEDYIIEFLKEYTDEYREAGQLQAEAYVDEWKKQLEDLKKAYEEVEGLIAPEYDVIEQPEGDGSKGGGGGSGKKGKGGGGGQKYYLGWVQGTYTTGVVSNHKDKSTESAQDAYNKAKSHFTNTGMIVSYTDKTTTTTDKSKYDSWLVFKKGGLADFTGPAWLDGTEQNPERILSPYQTQLFESMVQALERMNTVSIPTMRDFGGVDIGGASAVSVGDIIVNVDSLDTDEDYEEMAEKVSEILMERIGRTAVVGGVRVNSF